MNAWKVIADLTFYSAETRNKKGKKHNFYV